MQALTFEMGSMSFSKGKSVCTRRKRRNSHTRCWFVCVCVWPTVNNVDTERFVYSFAPVLTVRSASTVWACCSDSRNNPPHYTHKVSPHISNGLTVKLIGTECGEIIGIAEKVLYKQAALYSDFIYLNVDFSLKWTERVGVLRGWLSYSQRGRINKLSWHFLSVCNVYH